MTPTTEAGRALLDGLADAPDDETAWHCPGCGLTEYLDTAMEGLT